MKNPTRFYGIVLILLGILLGILDAFVPAILFVLVGLFMAAAGQPKQTNAKPEQEPRKRPQPTRTPQQSNQGKSDPKPGRKPARSYDKVTDTPAADGYSYKGSVESYFAELFAKYFPELRVFRNKKIAGSEDIPITFLLCRDDTPVLAVILCDSKEFKTAYVTNTLKACEEYKIPAMRFFRDFRNEAGYVVQRVRDAI